MDSTAPDSWAYSLEAEQAALGALLIDGQAFGRIADILTPEDFYTEDHASIFRAIAAISAQGHAVDLVTVHEHMERVAPEQLKRAGGVAYLGQLAQASVGALNIRRYAELVRERTLCRRVDSFALELSRGARAAGGRDVRELVAKARARFEAFADAAAPVHRLRVAGAPDLLNMDLPSLEPLLAPWLFEKSLAMAYSKRGVGKTHLALAVAFAVASGGKFLNYSAPRPRGVLFVDGEMPVQLMQRRLRELASGKGDVPELLRIVTPDLQDKAMPDLATAVGQAEIDAQVNGDTALIIIDNLSCLVRSGGAENESESWATVSEWALRHRRAGRAVIFIHHAGKSGAQRGTSKREDLLDVVINLRHPAGYQEADGAVFELRFEKARSLTGEDIAPIEARLDNVMGAGLQWTWRPVASITYSSAKGLWDLGGMSLNDIARELGLNKSSVARQLQKAMNAGELVRPYPSARNKEVARNQ